MNLKSYTGNIVNDINATDDGNYKVEVFWNTYFALLYKHALTKQRSSGVTKYHIYQET